MNFNSNLNPPSEQLELAQNSEVVEGVPSDLDNFALESILSQQDLPPLADFSVKPLNLPEKALYIVEIEGKFCFLDYAVQGYEPKPVPIEHSELVVVADPKPTKLATDSQNYSSSASSFLGRFTSFIGKKSLPIGIALGVLLTLALGRIFTPKTATESSGTSALVGESSAPARAVTIAEVTTTDIDSTLNVSGTVGAFELTPVMSQATGLQITQVLVERGDYVEQGQVLARLNDRVLTAEKVQAQAEVDRSRARLDELQVGSRQEEIAQAESRVANARSAVVEAESDLDLVQKRVERNTSLQAEGAISRDRLDEVLNQARVAESDLAGAKANLNEAQQALAQLKAGARPQTIAQAQAELAQAQGRLEAVTAQLADTTITATAAGQIAAREARVGQITSTSEMLFSIIQGDRLELRLQVPETLIAKIQPGQKVRITSNSEQTLKLTGEVRKIDPLIDNDSRQATVYVDLPGGTNLRPGMFLQAAVNTDTNQGQAVPIEALLPQSGNQAIAFIVQSDNTVKAQNVTMGEILPQQKIEIVEGLEPGDRIVLKGAAYLKDGDKVAIAQDPVSTTKQ
ncbi:MAG: efflux RND transporter periplasmic adaptor subunit [Cyanobacteria bacterium J06623_7]